MFIPFFGSIPPAGPTAPILPEGCISSPHASPSPCTSFTPFTSLPPSPPCRAYCTHADALWPPLWLALSACALELTGLPLLLLVPLLLAAFLAGVYCFAVVLAGVWT